MRSLTCVSVVVCVARKLHPCPSYSRRRDRINLGLWRGLCKGGGVDAARHQKTKLGVSACLPACLPPLLTPSIACLPD